MAHHHEEAGVLQVEVSIGVHYRIAAYLCLVAVALNDGELSDGRAIAHAVAFSEPSDISSEVAFQHFGYLEADVEVGIDVECGQRQHVLVA